MPLCPYCDEDCDEDIDKGVAVSIGTNWMHQACHKQFIQDQDAMYIQEMTRMYGHAWVIANVAAAITRDPTTLMKEYGL